MGNLCAFWLRFFLPSTVCLRAVPCAGNVKPERRGHSFWEATGFAACRQVSVACVTERFFLLYCPFMLEEEEKKQEKEDKEKKIFHSPSDYFIPT